MKSSLLAAAFGLFLTVPVWAQSTSSSSDSSSTPPAGKHCHWHHGGPALTQDERTELKTAHDQAIKDNPGLVAEGKRLHAQMESYMKQMHDAMVKADPDVEPILAKLEKDRPHHHHDKGSDSGDDSSSQ